MALVQAAFSFGRDRELLHLIEDELNPAVTLHDLRSDIDANRTWISLSGEGDGLSTEMESICGKVLDRIDLQRHIGEHPRTGALDVCNFIGAPLPVVDGFARRLSETYDLPVYLAFSNEEWRGVGEAGFGGLMDHELHPNYGPSTVHPRLGVTGIDMRPFYVTVAAAFEEEFAYFVKSRERDIRQRREDGDAMFAEVRAVAYPMASYGQSMLLIEFGNPDAAPPDPVLEWLDRRAKVAGVPFRGYEAIGAVRRDDLLETRNVPIRPEQIVDLD
jgi:glutamate formiminotransferase